MTMEGQPISISTTLLGREAVPLRKAHPERVFDVDWLPGTGALLATGSEANEARVWATAAAPAATGDATGDGPGQAPAPHPPRLLAALPHDAEVLRVAWRGGEAHASSAAEGDSPAMLATATATGTVRLYQVGPPEGGAPEAAAGEVSLAAGWAHPQQTQVYALKWLGDDGGGGSGGEGELLTAADDKVYFFDVEQRRVTNKWSFDHLPGCPTFGGDARNPDQTCYVFDAAVGPLNAHQGNSPAVCVALSDGSVRIHDRRCGRAVATLRRSASSHLTALRLSPEEGLLIACGGRGEATVYDTRNFSVRAVLQGHKRPCFGADVVPGDLAKRLLATVSPTTSGEDGGGEGGNASASGSGSADQVPPVVAMTWSSDTTLRFFDLSSSSAAAAPVVEGSSAPLPPFATVAHPGFPIYCAAFSPASSGGGRSLVIGGGDGQPQHHHNQHGHDHGGKGSGGCCGGHHAHDDEEKEDEEEEGARTLLMYDF